MMMMMASLSDRIVSKRPAFASEQEEYRMVSSVPGKSHVMSIHTALNNKE
jgi:hypothetical protein